MGTKHSKEMLPINLYVLLSITTFILWIPFPEAIDFMGANSILYAFVFAMGTLNRWFAYLALLWIPICILGMAVCYIFVHKKRKYLPFIVFVVLDMLVTTIMIVGVIFNGDYGGWEITIVGWFARAGYCAWMIHYIYLRHE